jgi:hypothetical protein
MQGSRALQALGVIDLLVDGNERQTLNWVANRFYTPRLMTGSTSSTTHWMD